MRRTGGEVRILGPVEVCGPHGRAVLTGARQRSIVAVLALRAGTPVAVDRLVDVLWGDDPPRTAVRSLHSHVARVRQALADCGMPGALMTKPGGYQLDASVDAAAFDRTRDLSLWRGEPLAGTELFGWGRAEIDRLRDQRIAALEAYWGDRLDRPNAIEELERLVVGHPTRERLVGLLMRALHRDGRHADALEVFRRLRHRLADELGVDPGPDLLALHTAILRRDPVLHGAKPAQLPARAGHFTGRAAEFAALAGLPPIVVVSGVAGVGKTTFAVEWARRVADRFPDGQVFLDLQRLTPAQALTEMLHSLGVPADRVPADPAALYRTLLHGKRVLILLDDVRRARDVLPLVPGDQGNLLLITSRDTLSALGTRHAVHTVSLDLLSEPEARDLLADILGEPRVCAESDATADLVVHCGRLPLALRIAAARLAIRPGRRIADLVRELTRNDPLDVLAVDGDDRTVRTVFASAHRTLSPQAARLFRVLGEHPGASFPADLADAMGPGLDELVASHLVIEMGNGRYALHDLIRLFARQSGDLGDGVERLLDRYLTIAHAAGEVLNPRHDLVTRPHCDDLPFAADRVEVLAYLDAERDNVLHVIRMAVRSGLHRETWQLAYLLTSYFEARGNWAARVEQCEHAVKAARALGDQRAEAEMLRGQGIALQMTSRIAEAMVVQRQALVLVREAGDLRGEARLHNNIGNAHSELRQFDLALESYRAAMEVHGAAGDEVGVALARRNLGYTYVRMGKPDLAASPLFAALETFRAKENPRLEAATLMSLGNAFHQLADFEPALRFFGDVLRISREITDHRFEADALTGLGVTHLALGDPAVARECLTGALVVCRALGDGHREASTLRELAEADLALGDLTAARDHLSAALTARTQAQDEFELAQVHRTFAGLEGRCGRWTEAARHWAQAVTLFTACRRS
ncbi:BTAD domain-containing putative transcriptional regulator [Lentzea sp. BCCO 10_0061]|uniref:BTAD domain-containing putative transcriptional regulator n=1 Tax=Lentzea sokolovensis TaxID=3095429 RepID=A0ABU4UR89_9PSEU|nr:BTAD domain-containing putative transcriptional regulator [Lentzea sp. BCCO 10_0061]MDX8142003.1 BTAD domain-containing putative transcriptional regulator [Lentzea sp. BCCO 10_0061]